MCLVTKIRPVFRNYEKWWCFLFIFQTLLKLAQKRRHPLSFGADDEESLSDDDDPTEGVCIGDAFTEDATTVADSSEDATTVADSSEDTTTVADSIEDASIIVDAMGRNKALTETINQTLKSFTYFKSSHQPDCLTLMYCTWIFIAQLNRKAQILNPSFFF